MLASWIALKSSENTKFTTSIIHDFNEMLLDILATVARKDYEDLRATARCRESQTIGKYAGRKPDLKKCASLRLGKAISVSGKHLGEGLQQICSIKAQFPLPD